MVLPARGWAAPYTTWNAGYSVAPHSSEGSVALTHFDDGFETAINPGCLENIDTLVFIDGGPNEGGFVKVWWDDEELGIPGYFSTAGIGFIEHTN